MLKIGDKVKVVKYQTGNLVLVGSYGKIIDIDSKREHTIRIEYDYIPKHITTKEEKFKDQYNGRYWTKESRLKKIEIANWKEELENE